jgi:hypothetical protein
MNSDVRNHYEFESCRFFNLLGLSSSTTIILGLEIERERESVCVSVSVCNHIVQMYTHFVHTHLTKHTHAVHTLHKIV